MMHKMICLLIFACALFGGGCEKSSPTEQAGTLEVWHAFRPEEALVFGQIAKEFQTQWNREHGSDICVNIHYVAYDDMFTKLRTAALARLTPDIAFVDSIKVTDLALGQALLPLENQDGFTRRYADIGDAASQFVTASFDSGIVNRKGEVHLYGLPVQTTTIALFWNRQMFAARAQVLRDAGLDPERPPRDWEEVIAYGKVLSDPQKGIYGYGLSGSLWFCFPFFNMYGVRFVHYDEQGRAIGDLQNPRTAAALENIRMIANSGIEGGAWKRSALSPEAGFLNKKYAMILTGPWMVENFTNAKLDFDISLVPAPPRRVIEELNLEPCAPPELRDELGIGAWSSSNVGGQTGVILRTSPQAALAYEFLEYFTSVAVQRRWSSELGQIPVRREAWKNLDLSKYPFLEIFMTQVLLSRAIPQIPLYGKLELDVFNPEMDLLLQKPAYPAQQMVDNMDRAMNRAILERINQGVGPGAP